MNEIETKQSINSVHIENAIIKNDLSTLSAEQRLEYYMTVCKSMGLNPTTQPLQYVVLNNKLTLYVSKNATDQLRHLHKISLKITSRERVGDVYIVTAQARNSAGREDESTGAVAISKNDFGDKLANLYMKAESKAKRRVTLSIVGLGFMDESEIDSIPGAIKPDRDGVTHGEDKANNLNNKLQSEIKKPVVVVPVSKTDATNPDSQFEQFNEDQGVVDESFRLEQEERQAIAQENAAPKCALCKANLVRSKAETGWYCRNFKDGKGDHSWIKD